MNTQKGIRIAQYLCLFPGLFLIVSGTLQLFFPHAGSVLFDLPNVEALKDPMALAMGIRQLAIGLMITTLVWSHQQKALGYIMVIGAVVPFTDFLVFSPVIGTVSALRHAVPVPMILGLGLYLLYQLRKQ